MCILPDVIRTRLVWLPLLLCGGCTLTVNSTQDLVDINPGNGVCAASTGQCTLRAAIMEAHAATGLYRVAVPAGTYPLTLGGAAGGSLKISKGIRLQGAGSNQTTIDATGDSVGIEIHGGETVQIQRLGITGGSAQAGGGMYVFAGKVDLSEVKFEDNYAFTGGGALVVVDGAVVEGDHVEFIDNTAQGAFGGAVWNSGRLVLRSSTMVDNDGNRAGALHNNASGSLNLFNVTVSGNLGRSNTRSVGGIFNGGFAVLRNTTVTDNEGGATSGAGGLQSTRGATTVLKNNILADNHKRVGGVPVPSDCLGPLSADSRYNLIQVPDDCDLPAVITTYIIGQDARLGALSNNGGLTSTHRLLSDSPAIDAGFPFPPGSPAADACRARDQRGVPRPQTLFTNTSEGLCDLGAFEAGNLTAYVTRFVLVNADSDTDIAPLHTGDVINRNELPPNLSVRAEVSAGNLIGSVVFDYDDTENISIENLAPYTIAGDASGDYSPFSFGDIAEHTIRATPYGSSDGAGAAGGGKSITVTVVGEE